MAKRTMKRMYRKGMFGSFLTGDTASHEGDFTSLRVVEAAVFQSLTGPECTGDTGDSIGEYTFPALYDIDDGNLSEFRLSSGVVQGFYGEGSKDPS